MTQILNPGPTFSVYIVYSIIKKLVTPFTETDAYKLGIIDKDGNVLRRRRTLQTQQEKNAYTVLDTLVFKLKRMLEKIPGGRSRLASYAAALWLIKEAYNHEFFEMNEEMMEQEVAEFISHFTLDEEHQRMLDLVDLAEGKIFEFKPKLKVNNDTLNMNFKESFEE